MAADLGLIAWHEDGRWNLSPLTVVDDLGLIMDSLKAQRTNGGALALVSYDEDFFIIVRALGSHMQMMISDVTYAQDSDLAAELLEILDLPFPEDDEEVQPGGDIGMLSDLGISAMEIEALCHDLDLFPDEQLDAIASRLGFVEEFREIFEMD